jgi:hypothetical protein
MPSGLCSGSYRGQNSFGIGSTAVSQLEGFGAFRIRRENLRTKGK